jgi:hypothetical protein
MRHDGICHDGERDVQNGLPLTQKTRKSNEMKPGTMPRASSEYNAIQSANFLSEEEFEKKLKHEKSPIHG